MQTEYATRQPAKSYAVAGGRKVRTLTNLHKVGQVAGNARPSRDERCEQRRPESKESGGPHPTREGLAP